MPWSIVFILLIAFLVSCVYHCISDTVKVYIHIKNLTYEVEVSLEDFLETCKTHNDIERYDWSTRKVHLSNVTNKLGDINLGHANKKFLLSGTKLQLDYLETIIYMVNKIGTTRQTFELEDYALLTTLSLNIKALHNTLSAK